MGIFGRKPAKGSAERLGGDPQELHDGFVENLMGYVDDGLRSANLTDPELRRNVEAALSALTWEALRMEDLELLKVLRHECLSYAVNTDDSLSIEEWGEVMFNGIGPVRDYLSAFLARGKPELERNLSLVASTQMDVVSGGPNYEPLMQAVKDAAGRSLGKP